MRLHQDDALPMIWKMYQLVAGGLSCEAHRRTDESLE